MLNLDNPLVSESGLDGGTAAGSGANVTSGTINIGSGNGVAVIVINGEVVWRDGELVNDTVDTGLGELRISSYDPATHTITYTYTLTDNDTSGGDVTDDFTITVTDNDGNTGTGTLVVTVKDDAPIAHDDSNSITYTAATAGSSIIGDVCKNDKIGADGFDGGAQAVAWSAVSLAEGSGTISGSGNVYTTDYGTLTLNANGSYNFTLNDAATLDGLAAGKAQIKIPYTITDGDGDAATATLTINITVPGVLKLVDSNSVHAGETYDALRGTEAIAGGNVGTGADALTPLVIRSAEGVDTITIGGTTVVQGGALVVNEVTTPHGKLRVTDFAPMPDGAQLTYTFQRFDFSGGSEPDIAVNVTDKLGQSCAGTIHLKIFDAPVPPDHNGNPVTIHPAAITAPDVGTVHAANWQPEGLPNPDALPQYDNKAFDNGNNPYGPDMRNVTFSDTAWNGLGGNDTITIKGTDWGRDMTFTGAALQGGAGDDKINITNGRDPMHIILTRTIVDGGEGGDGIVIGEGSWDTTLKESLVTGGTGNDIITIDSDGGGGNSKTIIKDTRVDGGDDDDTIKIGLESSTTSLEGSVVAGGEGKDIITIDAGTEISLINTHVAGDEGKNTIKIGANNSGNIVIKKASISSGEGEDIIDIRGTKDLTLIDVSVSAGDGVNSLTVGGEKNNTATLTRVSVSGGRATDTIKIADIKSVGEGGSLPTNLPTLTDVTVESFEGNDNISIGHTGYSIKLKNVRVYGGSDNDNIYVSHNVYNGEEDIAATFTSLENTTLSGDVGEDDIRVGGRETTFKNVAVAGGEDKDQISITGLKQLLSNAIISGGGDNDSIIIGDKRTPEALRNSVTLDDKTTVDGGEGSDIVFIHRYDGTVSLKGSAVVSGGAGDDTLFIGYSGDGGHTDVYTALSKVYVDSAWASTYTTKEVVLDHSTVYGGTGNDAIMIGDGKRSFDFDGTETSLKDAAVYGGEGTDTIQITGKTLAMMNVTVEGGTGADNISIGNTKDPDFDESEVTLMGAAVYGGDESDTIQITGKTLSMENAIVEGGTGDDNISITGVKGDAATLDGVTVDGGAGNDAITVTGEMLEGVEIFGGMGNDTLNATGATKGGARLFGGTGDDQLNGGAGNDYLHGGSGVDEISGGAGNDLIVYDIMDSKLDGGDGIDFVLSEDSDLTMDKLLDGWGSPQDGPHAKNVEVLLKGAGVKGITSLENAGITVDSANNTIELSATKGWTDNHDGTFTHTDATGSYDLQWHANSVTVSLTGGS